VRCLDHHRGNCRGEVMLRESLTGTGNAIARCDGHWEDRLQKQQEFHEKDAQYRNVDYLDAGERYEDD
jgi:hypothetical protein